MPHLRIETNVPTAQIPTDLPKKLCTLLAQNLGKPVQYCAATIIGNTLMSYGGTDEPTAQATLMSIGALGPQENKKYSKAISEIISKELGVSGVRMYIHFINAAPSDVGYNGGTF